ncbi:MAG: NAD-dependent epimerase/dehydratase family protein [Gammaproteobacteria bacterium]|nr:NAD-dependent epimerase/dehydratase family protein [Gammaproteobacteria bacterium]
MRVLVTGGAGFIGSNLVDELLEQGVFVRVLDNFSTGKHENLPAKSSHLEVVDGDVANAALVDQCAQGVDAIVHLAAVASVQASVDEPVETHKTNFDGTLNVLEAARQNQVERIIYASSAAIYGDTEVLPVVESTVKKPMTPYAADKLAGEYYLDFYHRQFGLKYCAFRFFNIYGPRQDPNSPYSGVISIFTSRISQNKPITIYGDGEQTRDFVFVKDLVKILTAAINKPDLSAHVVNVGAGKPTSLNEMIQAIEAAAGKSVEKSFSKARAGDIRHSLALPEVLENLLGIVPDTPLQVGIRSLVGSAEASRRLSDLG